MKRNLEQEIDSLRREVKELKDEKKLHCIIARDVNKAQDMLQDVYDLGRQFEMYGFGCLGVPKATIRILERQGYSIETVEFDEFFDDGNKKYKAYRNEYLKFVNKLFGEVI